MAQAGKHGMKSGPPGLGRPNSPVGWVTLSKLPARTFVLSSVSGEKTVHLSGLKAFAANMLSVMCDVTVMVTRCPESCFHGCYCASLTIYHCCPRFIKQVSVGSGLCQVLSSLSLDLPPQNLLSVEFCCPLGLLPQGLPTDGGQRLERESELVRGLPSPLTKELRKRVSTPKELPEDLLGAAEGEGEARPTTTRFCAGWASSWSRGRRKRGLRACLLP